MIEQGFASRTTSKDAVRLRPRGRQPDERAQPMRVLVLSAAKVWQCACGHTLSSPWSADNVREAPLVVRLPSIASVPQAGVVAALAGEVQRGLRQVARPDWTVPTGDGPIRAAKRRHPIVACGVD